MGTLLTGAGVIPTPFDDGNYLTFSSPSSFTMKFYFYETKYSWNGTLEYSTNKSNWNIWNGTTTITSVKNTSDNKYYIYLRGSNNTVISTDSIGDSYIQMTGSNVSCSGNIETLLDYKTVANGEHPTMGDYCFSYLFYNCTSLTDISGLQLPATTLAKSCYLSMFMSCASLTDVSGLQLPATILAEGCYFSMFMHCTSLTTLPALHATRLSNNCYRYMFGDCTSLTTPPELPAATLADNCYYRMFYGCTSLTTPPQLPATTLASYCYQDMFSGCTSLQVSSTKTGSYQYTWRIPKSGTGSTASGWNTNMLSGTGGTFTSNPTINTTYYVTSQPVG